MKVWIYYTLALLLGIIFGTIALRLLAPAGQNTGSALQETSAANQKQTRKIESHGARINRLLTDQSPSLSESIPLDEAYELLFSEKKSPLRSSAFLKHRIYLMTREQLEQALANGEIQTKAEITEAAARLTREDLAATFQNRLTFKYKLYGMPNVVTFIESMQKTAANEDPLKMLSSLQGLKRGGVQQYNSLRFSHHWAATDPAAAVEHFDSLVYLRNQSAKELQFTGKKYAAEIVKSWREKDPEALQNYVANLPEGEKRTSFELALKKQRAKATGR